MVDTTFIPGTVVASAWLNDVNTLTYGIGNNTLSTKGSGYIGFSSILNYPINTIGLHANADLINVWDYLSTSQLASVRAKDGLVDCYSAFIAAHNQALSLKRGVFIPSGLYKLSTQLDWNPAVAMIGEYQGWTNYTANTYNFGTWLFKAHNNHCISIVGTFSTVGSLASTIKGIAISSDKVTYPTGHGIYADIFAELIIENVNTFYCGGDGLHIGNTTTANNCTHAHLINCYANNSGGIGIKITAKWSRLHDCRSDGGTWGFWFETGGEFLNDGWHAEGFSVGAIKFANGAGTSHLGKGYIGNTVGSNLVGIDIPNDIGNGFVSMQKVTFNTTLAQNFKAINIGGSNVVGTTVRDCIFNNCGTGIDDGGVNTRVVQNYFFGNTLPIRANGDRYLYTGNRMESTSGANTINHVSGTIGLWQGNDLDKVPLPSLSGVQGNYSGIRVKDNIGFVTRNTGTTGSITSGTNISHGLAGTPKNTVVFGTYTSGVNGLYQSAASNATNIQAGWTGTANAQLYWEAACPCDY